MFHQVTLTESCTENFLTQVFLKMDCGHAFSSLYSMLTTALFGVCHYFVCHYIVCVLLAALNPATPTNMGILVFKLTSQTNMQKVHPANESHVLL